MCILGAQHHSKARISKGDVASVAKNQFSFLLEQCTDRGENINEGLSNYEKALTYSNSKVDFVYSIDLQMSPSDMVLKIGNNTVGYNNLIRKADIQEYRIDFKLGKNESINTQIPNIPSNPINNTGEKGVFIPQSQDAPASSTPPASYTQPALYIPPASSTPPAATMPASSTLPAASTVQEHEYNKLALIFMGLVIGATALMVIRS